MEHRPFDKNFNLTGANLVLADVNAGVEKVGVAAGFEAGRFAAMVGDVTQAAAREAAVTTGLERFGAIDILVNNAGLGRLSPALEQTEQQWDETMNLNVRAAFFLAQRVGAEMLKRGGGRIVNVASQAGVVALENHVAYCASKAAIISMTKVLALEWGPHHIQTNAISPTVVLTELGLKYWVGERGEAMKLKIPSRRFAYPEEIAACALFLASDAAAMINGENLVIDGGYTIQ